MHPYCGDTGRDAADADATTNRRRYEGDSLTLDLRERGGYRGVFVALGWGAYALCGVPDRSGVYHGCGASSGALRVVAKASSCRKTKTVRRGTRRVRIPGESAISWNQKGVAGAPGAP